MDSKRLESLYFAILLAFAVWNAGPLNTTAAFAAGGGGSCQSKLSTCTSELNTCMSQENTLTNNLNTCNGNLNTCNSNESTCTNSLSSCVNTLAALQGGTTGSTTRLLYTFVTNIAGFDTGIVISNTSADPFGTLPQSGPCTLTFFDGTGKTPAFTTPTISAGTTFTTLASAIAPGFQGYMFAECDFAFAHGAAFVSAVGARNLLSTYLALVVSKNTRVFPEGLDQ